MIALMRLLLMLLILGGLALLPFVMLRQPWAVRYWRRIRLLFVIYAIVILVSAIVALVFRWDAIYG
jgi:hypothetical protein